MKMIEKEILQKYIWEDNLSYAEIAKIVGVEYRTIVRWRIKLNILDKNTRGRYAAPKEIQKNICQYCGKEFIVGKNAGGFYCSQICSSKDKSKNHYEEYKLDNSLALGQKNMQNYKKFFIEEQEHKCIICGMKDIWNNKPIVFVLDHIDGNADNNERINLRLICPNCDSQLDTFKSKNKNSARSKYRQTLKVEDCK